VIPTRAGINAHLWCVALDIDADLDQFAAKLSKGERDRAAGFFFERDRKRFVVARSALRSILAARVGIPAEELEFEYGPRQKPALAAWCRVADLRFNLSHSQGLALVALTHGHEIGVDLERVRDLDDANALATREFSGGESAVFEVLPLDTRNEAFFRAWVRKEAFLKATGEGLNRALADIEVTFAPHELARIIAVGGDDSASQRWTMNSLMPCTGYAGPMPCAGYVGAVVVEAPAVSLTLHNFQELHQVPSDAHATPREGPPCRNRSGMSVCRRPLAAEGGVPSCRS
jgi:4'-phosphopantetheinyl transferase